MKFAIVTLFTLALALGVQPSVIPLGGVVTQIAGGPLAHTAVLSPGLHGLHGLGTVVVGHPPAAVPVALSLPGAIPTAIHASTIPAHLPTAISHLHTGIPAVHAAVPTLIGGPAGYVAKTRGAIHTAPLAGHLNSVANVNVAPAPGTI